MKVLSKTMKLPTLIHLYVDFHKSKCRKSAKRRADEMQENRNGFDFGSAEPEGSLED